MVEKERFKDLITYILIIGLFILAFMIVKPIIYSIIFGVLLAYIFYPLYRFLYRKTNSKNFSAIVICLSFFVLLVVIIGLILSSLLSQIINFSVYLQQVNFVEVLKESFPEFVSSYDSSTEIVRSMKNSLSTMLDNFTVSIGNFVLNTPTLLLQLLVVFLIFFFSLKDGEDVVEYLKSLAPFDKNLQIKFFNYFKDITNSVLVGQIVVGALQGLIAGIGYFVFGVPNALLITIMTMIIGVIPIIGPWLVWVPVDIYLFAVGKTGAGIGLLIYGLFLINWIDTIVRPMIVSRKTQINQGVVLIGMIGGLFMFGVLGLIIGPLILAYVLLVIELYRKQAFSEDLIFKKDEGEGKKKRGLLGKLSEGRG